MQKLTLNVTELTEKGKQAKTLVAVVASTKSANNLKDDLAQNDIFVKSCNVENVFIDKSVAEKHITALVEEGIKDAEIRADIIKHIMTSLDGACVFYKPPIKRK